MKRTTKAILIFIAVSIVLAIAATIFGIYNFNPTEDLEALGANATLTVEL